MKALDFIADGSCRWQSDGGSHHDAAVGHRLLARNHAVSKGVDCCRFARCGGDSLRADPLLPPHRALGRAKGVKRPFLIPVFAVSWGAVFLIESMTLPMLLGGAIVLVGAALTLGSAARFEKPSQKL